MPAVEAAGARAARSPPTISNRLAAEVGRGRAGREIATAWPAPHTGYFALEPPRRALTRLAAGLGALDLKFAAAAQTWSLKRLVDGYVPEAPAGLVEALRKLSNEHWEATELTALVEMLRDGGDGAKCLRHAPEIGRRFVAILAALPGDLRRPRILAHVTAMEHAILLAKGARQAVREGGDMRGLAGRLERARSTISLFRMLIEEIGLERLAPPPIPGTAWLKPIESVARINEVALRFENCLKGRIPMLLNGRAAYYEVVGEEPAVVEIVRDGQGLWVVGEVRGHANAAITSLLWGRIRAHLELHGARTKSNPNDGLAMALALAAGW